MKSKMRSLV